MLEKSKSHRLGLAVGWFYGLIFGFGIGLIDNRTIKLFVAITALLIIYFWSKRIEKENP